MKATIKTTTLVLLPMIAATICLAQQPVTVPAPTPYVITQQDGNSRTWQRTVYELSPSGDVVPHTQSYIELASGLNFTNPATGELEPAIAEVEILPDGTAAGTHGQHTTFFPVDIGNGVIRLVEPDGQEIRSEPLCLSYWDGANYVVIAGLTNSVGELVSSNQVLYPDAFGKGASLLYTYTRAGLEQDVVLEQQPPTPQSLGLNEDTARLQVMTEFFNAPQPTVKARTVSTTAGEVEDDSLTFGTMSMVSGKAFVLGKAAPSVGIERRWVTDDGRQILIEEVPVTSINDDLADLPMGRTSSRKHNSRRYVVSGKPVFPPQRHWRVSERHPARIARTAQASRGLVLDYNIVNGNLTNYVFRGDSTYYVSGSVNLFGGTFEGGTVIKFAPSGPWNWYPTGPTINLQDGYQYNWLVGEDRPVIMTAKDDNTIGNEISGSSGTPSGYYGFPALTISAAQPPIISHFRISWAEQAISVFNTTIRFYDGQFVNCLNGITGGYSGADFRNVLFADVYTNFDNFAYGSMDVQNATFKGSASLLGEIGQPGFSISLTNCILANVTNIGTGTVAGAYNGFYNSPEFGSGITNQFYPFQTVGGGSYYLTNGLSNAFRGAGTTNIDPALLADLQGRTTYGPFVCDETNISSLVTLNPYAARDTNSTINGSVDLGWHYEPIDFAFGGCSLKSNLTVTAGTAVGCFDDSGYGISLGNGAVLALNGTATQPCLFAFADMIQEGNGNWTGGEGGGNSGAFYFTGSVQSSPPLVSSTFTKYMADNYRAFFDSWSWGAGMFKNSEFYNVAAGAYKLNYLTFTNCLLFRASLSFWDTYVLNFTNENCTYYDGQLALSRVSGAGGDSSSFWTIENTIFDGTLVVYLDNYNGAAGHSFYEYNAYNTNNLSWATYGFPYGNWTQTNTWPNLDSSDLMVSNMNWETSWFGNFYLPTNSPLIQKGSTNANLLGLYHFTSLTNDNPPVVEGTNTVNIGYAYVATDTNGNPLSTPDDGTPDYIADANGNGIDDTNETPWDIGFQSEPQSTNVAQGQNATFSATVGGIGPFTYQWLSNSVPIPGATSANYTILVVPPSYDGQAYSIIASNFDGHVVSTNAILSVSTPIALTSSPSDDTVTNGGNASFTVTNSTGNHLIYQWYSYYNGVSTPLANSSRIAGVTGTNLTISPVQVSDGGSYYVVVGNAFNSVPSRLAMLTVITNPVISGMSPNTNAIQSDDVTFSVTDSGEQTNQWYFSNVVNAAYMIPGATQPSYTQLVVQPTNDGEYFVEASNLAGSTNAGALLNVLVPPWITSQPASTTNSQGQNATFSITAIGTTNLSYQWFMNGTNAIGWATNSSMTLTNIGGTNAGGYSCLVSNVAGTNMSAWAWLCVNLTGGGTTNGWGTNSSPASTGLTNWMVFPTNALASQPKVFIYGNPISIRAAATSQYGYVTNVAFYFTGTNTGPGSFMLAGNAVPGPEPVFALAWTNAIPGTNILAAVAQDYDGQTATSSLAYVIMAVAPGFTPAPGATLIWPDTNILLTAIVTNTGQPFNSTNHYVWNVSSSPQNSSVGFTSANSTNTQVIFSTNGQYVLTLSVDNGYATNVQTTTVMIDRAPNVYFNWPTNAAAVLAGAPIVLSATAVPYDGAITSVIFTNSTFLGPGLQSVSNSYTYLWQNPPVWTNTVWAIASCDNGLSSTTPVTFAIHPPLAVQFVAPTNGQLFIFSPTNIVLDAAPISYAGGNITSIVFTNLTQSIGLGAGIETSNSIWQDVWYYATNGTYTVSVTVYDSLQNIASNTVTFTNNALPIVNIISPANLQQFREITNVPIQVTATDIDGSINTVQIFAATNSPSGIFTNFLLGTATAVGTNYDFTWTNRPAGFYAIQAVATDNRGASTWAANVFTVTPTNAPPTCEIISPTNNSVFPDGADITISATTTNSTNSPAVVTNVEFFVNGVSIGNCSEPPYALTQCCWQPGTYQLTAIAADTLGSYGVSSNVQITVVPAPPSGQGFWDPTFGLNNGTLDNQAVSIDQCGNMLWPYAAETSTSYGQQYYVATFDIVAGSYNDEYSLFKWNGTNWYRWGVTNRLLNGDLSDPACVPAFPFSQQDEELGEALTAECAANATGLFVAMPTTNNIATYAVCHFDGTNWLQLGDVFTNIDAYLSANADDRVLFLSPHLQFVGADLYLYGDFTYNANTNIQFIAKWDPNSNTWDQVGSPLNMPVYTVAEWGGNLVVGGLFTDAGGNTNANCVAELLGSTWTNFSSGVGGNDYDNNDIEYPPAVFSLAPCGSKLYVGGDFTIAGTLRNVNSIAVWDGLKWSSINNGLIDDNLNFPVKSGSGFFVDAFSLFMDPIVYSISTHGNTIYVGGDFTDAVNPDNTDVSAASIIQATWNEAAQQWTWASMDGGIYYDVVRFHNEIKPINATTIIEGDAPGSYDVYVAGGGGLDDSYGGSKGLELQPFLATARWRVGYPVPVVAPVVTITNLLNYATFATGPGPTNVTVAGTVYSEYTTISQVQVFVDGVSIGNASYTDPSYSVANWPYGPGTNAVGWHTIMVTATDASNLVGSASILIDVVNGTNTPIVTGTNTYTIAANSPPINLQVLTNDTPTTGLKITGTSRIINYLESTLPSLGTISVSPNQTYLTYIPFPNVYGTDTFFYYVTNSTGQMAEGLVTVNILPIPWVAIDSPVDGQSVTMSALPLVVAGTNIAYGAGNFVTNVTLSIASATGVQHTNLIPVNGSFTNIWTAGTPGYYTFQATATDSNGMTNVSAPVTISLSGTSGPQDSLTAVVSNLNPTNIGVGFADPIITQGQFDLHGLARDTNTSAQVSYQVLLYPRNIAVLSGPPLANVTPGPLDPQGFHNGTDISGDLGTLDLSTIQNGPYQLILVVRGGSAETFTNAPVQLNTPLKVGQFTFSEQDLNLPVNGIPITVTRTYNSQNPGSADFGYGWTFAMNSLNVQLDEQRQNVQIGSDQAPIDVGGDLDGQNVSVRTGGGWDVSMTLPNGQQTTFEFQFSPNDYDSVTRLFIKPNPVAYWFAPPWVHALLTPINGTNPPYGDTLDAYGEPPLSWTWSGENTPIENQDLPGWILTTLPDQTKYYITRQFVDQVYYSPNNDGNFGVANVYGPPTLTQITERSGDSILLNPNSIYHIGPNNSYTNGVVTITRDGQGRITSISDPNAGTNGLPLVQYVYDQDTGNLIQVLKLLNRNTGLYATNRYDYNNPNLPHYITSIENADDVPVTRNTYDSSGRLSQTEDANDNITRYIYGPTGTNFEEIVDPSGNTNTMIYDAMGNVTETIDALGHTNQSAYDQNGYLTNSIDALGNSTTYVNDENGNPLSVTVPYPPGADPAAYTTSFTYDQYGNQTSITLPTGGMVTNVYDSQGNLTGSFDEQGDPISFATYNSDSLPVTDGDKFGTNYYGYDLAGNMTAFTNSLGGVTTSGYDANGNLTNLADGSGTGAIAYDALNRQTAADYGHGITVNYNYTEDDGNWSSVSGPTLGNMQRQLDDEGRLSGWNTANGSNPGFAYDNDGRLQFETNSIGVVVQSVYDAAGRLIATTNLATGGWSATGYDADGRKIADTNSFGQVTTYGYWPSGSLMAMTNAAGAYWLYSDAAGACSACGNSGSVTDILGRVSIAMTSPHDLPLQMIRLAYPDATGADAVTNSTTYLAGLTTPDQNAADYPASETDEGGRTRYYAYSSLGQLSQATDLSGATWWTNQYDASSGDLTNVLSPMGESLGYTYDDLDNVAAMRFADGNWLTNYYDSANRLSGVRLPTGICLTNLYDFAGRLTNHSSTIGETASFSYNGNDAITVMTDNTGSTTNYYDSGGRLWGIDYPSGAGVRYALDLLDRVTAITNWASAAGSTYVTRYKYDAIGNITNIVDPFNGQTSFTYDQVGRRTQRVLPNGIVTTWQYNWKDQVTNIVHKTSGGTVLASVFYTRAPGGEPLQITREDGSYVVLGYDAALRLTNEVYYSSVSVPQTTNSYGYDADGNRILLAQGGLVLTNSVSAGYQITAVKNTANGSTAESYGYDSGGRITNIVSSGSTRKLGYNSSDQVIAVTNTTAGTWVTYVHDAEGRRTQSSDSTGQTRRFVVAPTPASNLESPQMIANGSGTLQAGYVYDGGEPVLSYNGSGAANYYLEDGMGSVIGIAPASSPSTANTTRLFYDGFGNSRLTNGPAPVTLAGTGGDFRFQGTWLEADSGLYNMRAREYDARTGRFTSRDPEDSDPARPETLQPYTFANVNPFVYSDPSGREGLIDLEVATALQSGLAALQSAVVSFAENWAKQKIASYATDSLLNILQAYLPDSLNPEKMKWLDAGDGFGKYIRHILCGSGFSDYFFFEVSVKPANGMPVNNGLTCANKNQGDPIVPEMVRPDIVIGGVPPLGASYQANITWLVVETKIRTQSFLSYKNSSKGRKQMYGILRYAHNHTMFDTAAFVSLTRGNKTQASQAKTYIMQQAILKVGVIPVFISFDPRDWRFK